MRVKPLIINTFFNILSSYNSSTVVVCHALIDVFVLLQVLSGMLPLVYFHDQWKCWDQPTAERDGKGLKCEYRMRKVVLSLTMSYWYVFHVSSVSGHEPPNK